MKRERRGKRPPRKKKRPFRQRYVLRLRASPTHGLGVFAGERIPKKRRIVEYTGERISDERADRRAIADPNRRADDFMFGVNKRVVIDASMDGSIARFINHSCAPNCESVTVGTRVFIETLREIRKGEELNYDYHLALDGPRDVNWQTLYACHCGADECRQFLLEDIPKRYRKKARRGAARRRQLREDRHHLRLGGPARFPGEFASMLSRRGLEILSAGLPPHARLRGMDFTPVLLLRGMLSRTQLAKWKRLLDRSMSKRLRTIAASRLAKLRGARLKGRARAVAASQSIGLHQMLRSQSLRYLAEVMSGLRLKTSWDCHVLRHTGGVTVDPKAARQLWPRSPRHGRVDLCVALDSGMVGAQLVRKPAPPFSLPLPSRGGTRRAQWLLLGTFDVTDL